MADFVVRVETWVPDYEYSVYPEGSRDKELLRCPEPRPHEALIAGHRYLFKQSRTVYPEQFWAEVIAYRIGLLTGVTVPPAFPAWNSETGVCGALIEWFYGFLGVPTERYVSGGHFMHALIDDYDMKRGRQHNFHTIQTLCGAMARRPENGAPRLQADWLHVWARCLTFDALIGNTDRHHENWGLLFEISGTGAVARVRVAPAFDNGTSLGMELNAAGIGRMTDVLLAEYIERGRHHLRWDLNEPNRQSHLGMLQRLVAQHPRLRPDMIDVLTFDQASLEETLMNLPELEIPVPLSRERAAFMLRLTLARRDRLLAALTT